MDQRIATVENQVTEIYDIHKQKKRDYYQSLPKTYASVENSCKPHINPVLQEEYYSNHNYRNNQANYSISNHNNENNENYNENNYSNLNNSNRKVNYYLILINFFIEIF